MVTLIGTGRAALDSAARSWASWRPTFMSTPSRLRVGHRTSDQMLRPLVGTALSPSKLAHAASLSAGVSRALRSWWRSGTIRPKRRLVRTAREHRAAHERLVPTSPFLVLLFRRAPRVNGHVSYVTLLPISLVGGARVAPATGRGCPQSDSRRAHFRSAHEQGGASADSRVCS